MKRKDIPVTHDMIFFWPEERWKTWLHRLYLERREGKKSKNNRSTKPKNVVY